MPSANSEKKKEQIAQSKLPSDQALWDGLGCKPGKFPDEIFHNGVLCATYIQPEQTKGGIILTARSRDEDVYQGSIGMVIAMGPGAFKDDKIAQFHGVKLKVGDWVVYQPSDGLGMEIKGVPCRLFQDTRILGRVSDPTRYW